MLAWEAEREVGLELEAEFGFVEDGLDVDAVFRLFKWKLYAEAGREAAEAETGACA